MNFESAEIPTQLPVLSPEYEHATVFTNIGAVIWIIDSQDEYLTSISELLRVAVFLAENYPRANLEVFIHKTDGLSEEYKYDTFREVRQRVQDELSDFGYGDRAVSYYQTSIFDHSIFEAMSKVIMKLLPQLPAMETLLTKLCSTCRIQKAYLFDTVSKIYIATDTSPTFLKDYEVCSDYVDVIVDIKQLYGWLDAPKDAPKDGSQPQNEDPELESEGTQPKIEGVQPKSEASPSKSGSSQPKSAPDTNMLGESMVTFDKGGDNYMYAREISK